MIILLNNKCSYIDILDMKRMGFGVRIDGELFWNKEEYSTGKEFEIIKVDEICSVIHIKSLTMREV